jgi:Putative peptidoglycan binding domain
MGTPTGAGKTTTVGEPKIRPLNAANRPMPQPTPRGVHRMNTANRPMPQPTPVGMSTSSYPANAANRPMPTPRGVPKSNAANRPMPQPTPVGMSTSSYPANAANKPISQPKPQGMSSSSYPANAASEPSTEIAPAQFQQHRRIQGSDQWAGSDYQIFRSYRSEWHDRDWWRSHHPRIVFGVGGWYYWNAGYWCPAWGYDPGARYAYDGPIYAYGDLPPDQVVANVQSTLRPQGYYDAEADGLLGPVTRAAIVNYQREHGLHTTSTIDRPTSESLGMK